MIRNYIKVALRNFQRNLTFSLINVIGLSVGMAGSFVIGNWVIQELSYERSFKDYERIHRVSVSFYSSGAFASGPNILLPTLRSQAPEVELATRINFNPRTKLKIGDQVYEESITEADSAFFEVFPYPFIAGNPGTALDDPTAIVLSRQKALTFFNSTDIIGETILVGDNNKVFRITGVVAKPSKPTHIPSEIWIHESENDRSNWTGAASHNYVKLNENASEQDLANRLELIKQNIVFPTFQSNLPYEEWELTKKFDFHTVALKDIHLSPDMKFEATPGGKKSNVYIFMLIAIFLVILASINFINLSTAQSTKRAKEVGIRKSLGTSRKNLVGQYLFESVMVSVFSVVIGMGLAEIFLILFQSFTNQLLIDGLFDNIMAILAYLTFGLLIGILSGAYPAFYLSRFKPVNNLKSTSVSGANTGSFRNLLVVFQFTVSISLIIGSIIVYNQLKYLQTADIGVDRENVMIISNASALGDQKQAFKQVILEHPDPVTASFNKRIPAGLSIWVYSFASKEMEESIGFQSFIGDDQYIPAMGFRLLEGRNFSSEIASDSSAVILSESAIKELGLQEPVVGTELKEGYTVIGVISDFSYKSFIEKPDPTVLLFDPDGYRFSIRITGLQTADFIRHVEENWSTFASEPISYTFLDATYENLMEAEKTLVNTVSFFTGIAILISCLGLLGLAAYTAQQKTKEIGIRKVMGASLSSIILLLNLHFTKLVIISTLIAVPLSWYLMDQWLQNYTYQVYLNVLVFVMSGLAALIISWLTVGILSFKAASVNPVESLRSD